MVNSVSAVDVFVANIETGRKSMQAETKSRPM